MTVKDMKTPHNGEQKVGCIDGDPYSGLTKREYFAAMAMQGLIANKPNSPTVLSMDAIAYADALLKRLDKEATP